MNTLLIDLINYFNPDIIWGALETGSQYVVWVSPLILLLSYGLVIIDQSKGTVLGKSDFTKAFMEILWPAILYIAYVGMGAYIVDLVYLINESFARIGSFNTLSEKYDQIIAQFNKIYEGYGNLLEGSISLLNLHTLGIAYLLFIGSFILVIFVNIFLKFGFAALFVFNYLWGFIAIPTVGRELIGLDKGWTRTWLGLATYGMVHGILFMILTLALDDWALSLAQSAKSQASENAVKAGMYFLFAIINFLVVAIEIVSIWVAHSLSSNQNALMAGLAPFAAVGGMASTMYKKMGFNAMSSAMTPTAARMGGSMNSLMNSSIKDTVRAGMGGVGKLMPSHLFSGSSSAAQGSSLAESLVNDMSEDVRGVTAESLGGVDVDSTPKK